MKKTTFRGFNINDEAYRKFKMYCALYHMNIGDVINNLIKKFNDENDITFVDTLEKIKKDEIENEKKK